MNESQIDVFYSIVNAYTPIVFLVSFMLLAPIIGVSIIFPSLSVLVNILLGVVLLSFVLMVLFGDIGD